ncbi:MAG: histidine phosphatase family protein [Erysipelotrichaceae bacterium]|nr:histidine phosphatase family protein [Erysipelotrichaceae bacterium]
MKTVYFIRHSKTLSVDNKFNEDTIQGYNEKGILLTEGEKIAKEKFKNIEFDDIEEIYSSNYVRAMQTAKILAEKNNLTINVVSNFGERKIGITSWDDYPKDFEIHQFNDNNYKLPSGESLNEVRTRELKSLNYILDNSKAHKIAIVFHSTAMMTLLKTWCDVSYDSDYYFRGNKFFDGKWDYCETFKLVFDSNNNLVSIENIR